MEQRLQEILNEQFGKTQDTADSRQVYRGMDIGTGKDLSDYVVDGRTVPYHLIDIAEPGYKYNVFEFQRDFLAAYESIRSRRHIPILCGGTGLYLNAVIDEMEFPSGERGGERRSAYEGLLALHGASWLHRLLEDRDPRSAALIHPNNTRRVVRGAAPTPAALRGSNLGSHHESRAPLPKN